MYHCSVRQRISGGCLQLAQSWSTSFLALRMLIWYIVKLLLFLFILNCSGSDLKNVLLLKDVGTGRRGKLSAQNEEHFMGTILYKAGQPVVCDE